MTRINVRLQRSVDRFIRKWEAVQVELHGHYSVERFAAMNEYSRSTSLWRSVMVLISSPLPCLILVALLDAIPLEAPAKAVLTNALALILAAFICYPLPFASLLLSGP
eukprot:jgi/Phyca11/123339/e_gw1.50.436.1